MSRHLSRVDAFFCLRGRELVVKKRVRRRRAAETLWPLARRYGRLLASIPFVRGLAVTGALAPENEDADGDVDFLVLVKPGCIWRVHGFAWVLVKLHQLLGAGRLCANYIVSDDTPPLPERNLYIAYELSLMVTLYGPNVVDGFRDTNDWRATYLPNAHPRAKTPLTPLASPVKTALETLLNTAFGRWLETRVHGWKLRRVARRTSTIGLPNTSNGDGVDEGWAKHERGWRVQSVPRGKCPGSSHDQGGHPARPGLRRCHPPGVRAPPDPRRGVGDVSRILFGQCYYLRFDPKLYGEMQPYPPLGCL